MGLLRHSAVRLLLLPVSAAALLFFPAQAQTAAPKASTTLIEPPAPLLPTNSALLRPGATDAIPAETPALAAILKEDGLVRSDSRVLAGAGKGWVIADQFGDATGAYSAFTTLAAGGAPTGSSSSARKPGHEIVRTASDDLILLNGVSVVRVHSSERPESLASVVRGIDTALPKIGGRRGLAPLLPTLLPTPGLERSSIRYALGPEAYAAMEGVLPANLIDWSKSTEAITAHYRGGGVLTLLLYPTPQIAGNSGRTVEQAVNQIGPAHLGTVKLRRVGPLLGMTSGTFAPEQAEALLAGLKLNQIVSFDQKMPLEFHAEVKKTASLLENIAVLTGVLVLAAVLLGLFLGGARAGIRVLQGKPAASEPEFLTINLRDQPEAVLLGAKSGSDGAAR